MIQWCTNTLGGTAAFRVVYQDCNCNGVLDSDEIASGTSQDCNANGIPDQCDIAFLTSQDCNANTVPDACDIASGASEDLNTNAIPDDCECLADIDNDTFVTVTDLLVLLATWGPCPPVGDCFGDIARHRRPSPLANLLRRVQSVWDPSSSGRVGQIAEVENRSVVEVLLEQCPDFARHLIRLPELAGPHPP